MKTLKTFGIIAIAILLSGNMTAQDFSKYDDVREITSIIVNKNMFKLMSKLDMDSEDEETQMYINIVENLDDVKIFTTENSKYAGELKKDFETYRTKNNLEELMQVNDEGKQIKFYIKPGKSEDFVNQLVMFINSVDIGDEQSVLMMINGNIDLKNISKLTQKMNIPGGKSLENLDNEK
ncbi:DUF4252 domain-containing protein [Psychroflexus aestuariivivens]|uniref:DUF4252 domain-containing protein n=1 Tax=Psychroflexus aestuariivivens TaxID=1795040 RepID=UPI000FDB2D33|nr:DUF4252 domain-containing protein [Psychroflexus aestuariivivens]